MIKDLSEIALPQDLIRAVLIRVSKMTCKRNEMHQLVGNVHDTYKDLPENFNFEGTFSECFRIEEWFKIYTEKLVLMKENIGWHFILLKYAVYLNIIYIYVKFAIENL